MVVRKKMFRDCSWFRTVCLFVNCSAVLVKTVFKSSFCFSYVLLVAAVAMYHVNNVFRVAVNMMSDKSRFAGRMKCVTGTSVRYVVACQTVVSAPHRKEPWGGVLCVGLGSLALKVVGTSEGNKRSCFENVGASGR